jgi:hypothetical protein
VQVNLSLGGLQTDKRELLSTILTMCFSLFDLIQYTVSSMAESSVLYLFKLVEVSVSNSFSGPKSVILYIRLFCSPL